MNREETLAWIDDVMDALDQFEVMAIIEETIAAGHITPEFFETLEAETDRLKTAGEVAAYNRLLEIARTIAIIRQNRKENL
ncbi:MAG: hypothetical protein ACE5G8_03290 [Anaerolineae bacterium]